MKVLLDNGHGKETPGKRSPDGRLREWEWTRKCVHRIGRLLAEKGIEVVYITPEDTDVPLRQRCRRANEATGSDTVLISLHINAAGDGTHWHDARGWCAFVAPNASANSRRLARLLYAEAMAEALGGNRSIPPQGYLTASLAICRDTRCPAVLTENLFQDNRKDTDYLLTEEGVDTICRVHINAILKYFNQ